MFDVVVLGCGWAGALSMYELAKRYSVVCMEGENTAGGLLKTEFIDGFTIDIGGTHIIYSKDRAILQKLLHEFLNNEFVSHTRSSYIMLGTSLVPYPLENGLYVLPPEERADALISFLEAFFSLDKSWHPRNLLEWAHHFFGKWIAEKYLIPYNKKVWKRPLEEIDADWIYIPGRLPIPDWRDVAKAAVGIPTEGYPEQAKFYYPLKGGIMSLFRSVYEKALDLGGKVMFNIKVNDLRKDGNEFVINGKIRAKRVVNTIPLPDLINALNDVDSELEKLVSNFDFNSVVTVAVAVNKRAPRQHWIYVPDERIVFHRYVWMSNYSPYNSPPDKSLIVAEVTLHPDSMCKLDVDSLVEKVVDGLESLNAINRKDIIFTKAWIHRYGYPIHKVGFSIIRDKVLDVLRNYGIVSVGRWGKWRYLNMDMVVKDVVLGLSSVGLINGR